VIGIRPVIDASFFFSPMAEAEQGNEKERGSAEKRTIWLKTDT
jgi:hypothetical protein